MGRARGQANAAAQTSRASAGAKPAPEYKPVFTAKRVGDVGELWSAGSSRGGSYCGADEFFSTRDLPERFLRACNEDAYPASNPDRRELIDELAGLFAAENENRTHHGPSAAEQRDGIWWSPINHHPGGFEGMQPTGLEVKRDLYEFVDRAYQRSRGGGPGAQGWKYPKRGRLPTMEWRLVTRENGETWMVLASRGFAGRSTGFPMAGAVRLHSISD